MFLAALLAVALAWPASAADPAHRPRCNDLRALAKALGLSREQVQASKDIYRELKSTVEPLREEIDPLREELQAMLDEDHPAPGQVGQVVIDIDSLRDQIDDAKEAAENEFESLLTPEQLEKYHVFEQHCRPAGD
jgi:Spy/CpxP family protein refolding chaperone